MNGLQEPSLSDTTFQKLASLFFQKTGITLKEHKKYLLIHRISHLVGPGKSFPRFEDYYQELLHRPNSDLMKEFINRLTTNYSFFFRDRVHFDFLMKYLQENASKQDYIRLWSTACSTGEETYSMAISALTVTPEIEKMDFKILGTDISTRVLQVASQGIYEPQKIRNHIKEKLIRLYFDFDAENNQFIVKPRLKKLIAFRHLNLMDSYPFKKLFDIVFLRNVLIYFSEKEKEKAVAQIYDYVKPGGYLVTGMSENLVGFSHRFKPLKYSIYKKMSL